LLQLFPHSVCHPAYGSTCDMVAMSVGCTQVHTRSIQFVQYTRVQNTHVFKIHTCSRYKRSIQFVQYTRVQVTYVFKIHTCSRYTRVQDTHVSKIHTCSRYTCVQGTCSRYTRVQDTHVFNTHVSKCVCDSSALSSLSSQFQWSRYARWILHAQWVHTVIGNCHSAVSMLHKTMVFRVGQNPIYIRCVYGIFGREITIYTIIYGVCIRFWPTLMVYSYRGERPTAGLYLKGLTAQ
jgi:hypothetical protein